MTADSLIQAPNIDADKEREDRIASAMLRGVVDTLKSNRLVVPVFGLAICGMFPQWIPGARIGAWYAQMLLGLAPQLIVLWRFPHHALTPAETRKWTRAVAASNLFFVANWASLGWYMWAPGARNANHIMVQLILAATLAAHAAATGPCRAISRPALLLCLAVMTLVPLQGLYLAQTFTHSLVLALCAPLYAGFILFIANRNYRRARATVLLGEERNALLAELVMAKLESDHGRERAEAASLAKSQFLANMSHELRTPLNAILGFSEMISTRMFASDPERNVEYAALINSSGHHLLALINDILDLAKIEAGRWKLEEAELDLHRIVDEALQLVAWRAKDNNATLENTIPPDIALLYADERAIKQILLNLLSNAVKFTPENGRVTAFAHVGADGGMVLGVRDTGIGIATDDLGRVFDSFGQGKHDIALPDKGTGLGLAIVKGLSEAHGGHVTLTSTVGKGTTVTVHMPDMRVRPRPQRAVSELAHFVA
jgi:two-component system cell cycle sensor histidine kinase PleC